MEMSLRRLPVIENFERPDDEEDTFPSTKELDEWRARNVKLRAHPAGTVINILEPMIPGGVSVSDIEDKLRNATGDVTVNINSPGGYYSIGASVYTMLQNYPGKVIVNVIGIAGSAASLAAMGGDEIRISSAGAIMIHNAQVSAEGDRHVMTEAAQNLGKIDAAIRRVYAQRTGQAETALDKMMTPLTGTWLFGKDAVDKGFADTILADDAVVKNETEPHFKSKSSRAVVEAALAEKGYSRRERRSLFRDAFPDRTDPDDRRTVDSSASLAQIAEMIRNIGKA